MLETKLEELIAAIKDQTAAIRESIAAKGQFVEGAVVEVAKVEEKKVKEKKSATSTATPAATPTSNVDAAPVVTETKVEEAVKETPAPVEEAVKETPAANEVTYEQVRDALMEVNKTKGRDGVLAILQHPEVNAANVPAIKPEAFAKALELAKAA